MKATAYLQIAAERSRHSGDVRSLKVVNITQSRPRSPEPGAMVVKVAIDVDAALFEVPTIAVTLEGSPAEAAAAVVPVPHVEDGDES